MLFTFLIGLTNHVKIKLVWKWFLPNTVFMKEIKNKDICYDGLCLLQITD